MQGLAGSLILIVLAVVVLYMIIDALYWGYVRMRVNKRRPFRNDRDEER